MHVHGRIAVAHDEVDGRTDLMLVVGLAGHQDAVLGGKDATLDVGYAQRLGLRNTARQNARQERALEVVQNDPFVQTLVREFDARIVPGSVLPL